MQQAQLETAEMPALVGGRYRVEGELGRGGMARVYRVIDERSGQPLALKKLSRRRPARLAQAMFEREYHALVQLAHPRIVRVFDYGRSTAASPYYTMELLDGADARETRAKPSLGVREICLLAARRRLGARADPLAAHGPPRRQPAQPVVHARRCAAS